jgi:hypothetical protein
MSQFINPQHYADALRALAPFAVDADAAQVVFGAHVPYVAAKYVAARDVLRKASPCNACEGHGILFYNAGLDAYGNRRGDLPRACSACSGAGWSQASLDAHQAALGLSAPCEACEGSGRARQGHRCAPCVECSGSGMARV